MLTTSLTAEGNALSGSWCKGKKEKKKEICLGYSKTEILITPVMRENLKFHQQP